jgi:serine/threonine protein kinase
MTNPHDRELEIFSAARRLPAAEQGAYLDKACAGDVALRNRVENLLSAADQAGNFLENPAALPSGETIPVGPAGKPGDKIGRYKLLHQIGEGGCGVVYMAEQTEPLRRQVALKVIKLGMDTKSVIARFDVERQALALMDHPNIAKVLDAGATQTGRPYFVMELVRGIKITEFCDKNKLPTRQRLQLFVQVCQAIQHAHQKGIIHRDIKPSNILVTLNDGMPLPKVIDFGIAKATQQRLTDKTLFTAFEQFIGTPAYMSPEQAEMSAQGVDTRSDIYSLGVLLYELLTGKTPFGQQDLLQAGVNEIRRIIREVEPMKPSTRLSTMLQGELTLTANYRQIEPPKLIHTVRGELDWIVMKALEKERNRRYETANGFARDVERYLANEPVTACPPSKIYQFRKTVQRNKFAFTASISVFVALMIGLGISSYLYLQEKKARQEAITAEHTAQTEAAKSRQVAQFLQDMLKGVGPSVALGRDTKILRDILETTEQRISKDLKNQPELRVSLQATIAEVYYQLGAYFKSEALIREILKTQIQLHGENSPEVALTRAQLSSILQQQNKTDAALSLMRQAIEVQRKQPGDLNTNLVFMLANEGGLLLKQHRWAEGEAVEREALAKGKKIPGRKEHGDLALAFENLGAALAYSGKLAEGEAAFRESLAEYSRFAGGDTNLDINATYTLHDLALVLLNQGKIQESEDESWQELALLRRFLGNEHVKVAETMDRLGTVLANDRKLEEAEHLFRGAWEIRRKKIGAHDKDTVGSLGNLGSVLIAQGKTNEAEQLFLQELPPELENQQQSLSLLRNRGACRVQTGELSNAASDFNKALLLRPDDLWTRMQLTIVLASSGDDKSYRNACHEMLKRFGTTTDAADAERVAKACLLSPIADPDLQNACRLADFAVTSESLDDSGIWRAMTKSLAEYRQGHFESAAQWARKTLTQSGTYAVRDAAAYALLAMSLARMNHGADAKAALLQGNEIAEKKIGDLGCIYFHWSFHDILIANILLREANGTIKTEPHLEN